MLHGVQEEIDRVAPPSNVPANIAFTAILVFICCAAVLCFASGTLFLVSTSTLPTLIAGILAFCSVCMCVFVLFDLLNTAIRKK
jgi:ABC-type siderophore export system fused ATPase/permease subunit